MSKALLGSTSRDQWVRRHLTSWQKPIDWAEFLQQAVAESVSKTWLIYTRWQNMYRKPDFSIHVAGDWAQKMRCSTRFNSPESFSCQDF
jgi:hypothetical protein